MSEKAKYYECSNCDRAQVWNDEGCVYCGWEELDEPTFLTDHEIKHIIKLSIEEETENEDTLFDEDDEEV